MTTGLGIARFIRDLILSGGVNRMLKPFLDIIQVEQYKYQLGDY